MPPIVQGKGLLMLEQPSYRFTTQMSYWGVLDENGSIIGHSEGTRDSAESALAKIVGSEVSGLEIYINFAVDIRFSNGDRLTIRPYPQNTQPEDDLWSVREPDGFYSLVRYDGQMYCIHEHEKPIETKMNE